MRKGIGWSGVSVINLVINSYRSRAKHRAVRWKGNNSEERERESGQRSVHYSGEDKHIIKYIYYIVTSNTILQSPGQSCYAVGGTIKGEISFLSAPK